MVSGYEDGTFGPEAPITREQIAALLWNQQGGSSRHPGPVNLLLVRGHVNPTGIGTAQVREIAGFLIQEKGSAVIGVGANGGSQREQESPAAPFTDGEAISAWARTAVNWAYETKMMSGTPEVILLL